MLPRRRSEPLRLSGFPYGRMGDPPRAVELAVRRRQKCARRRALSLLHLARLRFRCCDSHKPSSSVVKLLVLDLASPCGRMECSCCCCVDSMDLSEHAFR